MSNIYSGLVLHQPLKGRLDLAFVLRVQGRCCLVQQQHRGLPEDGSRDGNSLLLSARDMRSLGADFLEKTVALLAKLLGLSDVSRRIALEIVQLL